MRKYEPRVVDGKIFILSLISVWNIEKQTYYIARAAGAIRGVIGFPAFKVVESLLCVLRQKLLRNLFVFQQRNNERWERMKNESRENFEICKINIY